MRVLAALLEPLDSREYVVVEYLVINGGQLLIFLLIQDVFEHQHSHIQGFGLDLRLLVVKLLENERQN